MSELFHECGIAAVYHLDKRAKSPLAPPEGQNESSRLMPRMLLDLQNRGQLAAGMATFHPRRSQLINTHKDVGTVAEVFRLNHRKKYEAIMRKYAAPVAIGHTRYATCGKEDRSYAQPFERHHIEKSKWFSFGFNGQLANYPQLRAEILAEDDFHLARETDTEILRHLIGREISEGKKPDLIDLLVRLSQRLDGAYNIVFLNAQGDMFVCRDPLGFRPLSYAFDGSLFAAASESVALANLGFQDSEIKSLPPGCAAIIEGGEFTVKQFVVRQQKSHCFFEWIYFANMASTMDDRSVYLTRKRLGEELAAMETLVPDDETIIVPVPDTAKGAAASMAHQLNIPLLEGLLRNRYSGRTFIEGEDRANKARMKYTPLPEVLSGKRVLLVEDSIVRSTTMRALIGQLRTRGRVKEVHVRVACPPIIAPCFYGIDMSTVSELFAPKFMDGNELTSDVETKMAAAIGADSLRYLPVESIARCLNLDSESLCQACINTKYPTTAGRELYHIALGNAQHDETPPNGRTYDT
ncbi:MAG: amidophosphoribosyltransferase [Planctomycetes bacterium]|nr:amidophosphoribosyltransferase [Planctomycetota bacterium]